MARKPASPPPVWRKTEHGLVPACERAERYTKRLKDGDLVTLAIRAPRNIKLHRKYWVLMGILAESCDRFETAEHAHFAIKAALGHGEWFLAPKATREVFIPYPTDFESMDGDAFSDFYNQAVNVACKYFLTGMTPEQVDAIAMEF